MKGSIVLQIAICYVILSLKCVTTQAQCGSQYRNAYSGSEEFIQSPGYPSNYARRSSCTWVITAPIGYHVQLTFLEFKTYGYTVFGRCQSFVSDILEVYDSSYLSSSKLLGKYCGSDLPATVGSTSRYLYIKFTSSSSAALNHKFRMKYKAVRAPSQDGSTCSPFFSSITNSNIKVSTSLNSSFKYIESPLYPNKYPSNIKCVWYITAPPSANKIQLILSEVKIYGYSSSCSSSSVNDDVLTIRDGPSTYSRELKTICKPQYSAQTITSSGLYMTIIFTSNEDNNFKSGATARFKMRFTEIGYNADSSLCSPSNSYSANNNIRLKSSSGIKYIKSPWYPNNYPMNIQCTWYITASSSSKRIELTLSNVKIYNKYSYSCNKYSTSNKDILTITDGSSTYSTELKSVCSSVSSSTVRSTGRYMTVKFKTDSDDYVLTNNAGFNLKYYEYEPDPNVGMIVGIVFGVIFGLGILICCVWMCKRKGNVGNVHRVPAATTTQSTTMTTSHAPPPGAPQYPMQTQGGPTPAQGSFAVPAGSYPPPGQPSYPSEKGSYPPPQGTYPPPQGSYPPPQGSYPPPQGSYPPPIQGSFAPPGGYSPYPQGSFAPPGGYSPYPQGSYIPPVNDPVPSEPPPQYPGINADSSQATPASNPQFQGPPQASPPYPTGGEYPMQSGTQQK